MISTCCQAETEYTEIGICPECQEHCDFEEEEESNTPYELWQLEKYGNIIKEDETQHDVEPDLGEM